MKYKTHITTTLAASLPVMVATNSLSMGSAIALGLGAVFPDIDEPHSFIGSRMRGISDVINFLFDHRGITHSLTGNLIMGATALLGHYFLNLPLSWAIWFSVGYFLHLVEDSFSKSGVAWLQPFSKQSLQFGFNKIYYVTGGMVENVIFALTFLLLVFQVTQLDLQENIKPPDWGNIETFVSEDVPNWVSEKINK